MESELENKLVKFVESHPETFDEQSVRDLRRNIIIFFSQIVGPPNPSQPNVIYCVSLIIKNIYDKLKVKSINTSQDVNDALKLFELCMECQLIIGGRGNREMLDPPSPPDYRENLHGLVKRKINEYHAKVLKLWADVLFRKGKITQSAIDVMQARVSAQDGYEQKMRELYGNPSGMVWGAPGRIKNNLDESVLLDFLTLFYVATHAQITARYDNIGPLDSIVLLIISQFVPTVNHIPQFVPTGNHTSKLNMLKLKCIVILTPSQTPSPPVTAYLSSDILDRCVQSSSHFPNVDEVMFVLQNTAPTPKFETLLSPSFWKPMPTSPTPKFETLSPSFWKPMPTSPVLSPTSPVLSPTSLEGGKIRRNTNKKRKKCKKNRRSHRR